MALTKLPTRNMMVIILFGTGLLAFILLSVFPNYIAYSNINHKINTLKNKIEEQKILSPIFEDLSEKAKFEEPDSLPFPKTEKLSKHETSKISSIIQKIILDNDYKLESIVTDVDSLMKGSDHFKISILMQGEFMNLRNIVLQLGTLPYLDHIELIQINNHNEINQVRLEIWIAQEQ